MVEFVNNREETIAKGVAKAISRHGDGVHDDCVKFPLQRVMGLITTTALLLVFFFLFPFLLLVGNYCGCCHMHRVRETCSF